MDEQSVGLESVDPIGREPVTLAAARIRFRMSPGHVTAVPDCDQGTIVRTGGLRLIENGLSVLRIRQARRSN